ncbi:MAG: NAD(P)/FAD-dependent oxidoreductase [Dermatophilaceae bacterium]
MADASYDAILIGGGHHASIVAPYLAKAGLKTLVLERHTALGGAAISEEGPAPGFLQSPCAHWTRFYGHPAYWDFDLPGEGLEYIFPEQNEGIIFDDGSSFIGYSAYRVVDEVTGRTELAQDNVDKTYEQIKAFSQRDADTYLRLFDAYNTYWKAAFHTARFSAPTPWSEPDPMERLLGIPDSQVEPVHQFMSTRQIAYDYFESDELRSLYMRATPTSGGTFPDDPGGLHTLFHVMGLVLSFEPASIVKGGTRRITETLVSAGRKLGVEYLTGQDVDRIVVDGGRAVGVTTSDGTRVDAPVVVSDLGMPQTYLRLLRDYDIGDKIRHRLHNINYDRGQVLWGGVALHEQPQYLAENVNPGVGSQPRLYTGPKDPEYLASKWQHEIFLLGVSQRLSGLTAPDSIWDPSRAADGKHMIMVEEFTAPARFFSAREWGRIRDEYVERWLDEWPKYAPNMTRDNVIATRFYTPYDILAGHPDMLEGGWPEGSHLASQLGRFRPFPELAGPRSPIPGLYHCSSNVHSAAGIGRGSGYIAAKAICEDRGLPRFWDQPGRTF